MLIIYEWYISNKCICMCFTNISKRLIISTYYWLYLEKLSGLNFLWFMIQNIYMFFEKVKKLISTNRWCLKLRTFCDVVWHWSYVTTPAYLILCIILTLLLTCAITYFLSLVNVNKCHILLLLFHSFQSPCAVLCSANFVLWYSFFWSLHSS